jgi:ComF family protein
MYECTECNDHTRKSSELDFNCADTATYVAIANDVVQRMVATYKDRDEKRLAPLMATYMARFLDLTLTRISRPAATSPNNTSANLQKPLITFVPDSKAALARRGFDHMELLAKELAKVTELQMTKVFERPHSADQRKLSRKGRAQNIRGAFRIRQDAPISHDLLIIDDISTTGATIYGAAEALQNSRRTAGINAKTHILTFGKVLD